jgi:hypothetical protein
VSRLTLVRTKRTDPRLLAGMAVHYSQPKGFVGRNICYAVLFDGDYYGHIVAGSATRHLPGRHEFLGTTAADLNRIVNNIYFHIEPIAGRYPVRNFATAVLARWREVAAGDWAAKYGDPVSGFESLVELPRTGEIYHRDGWAEVGLTKGYTCKRVAGKGTDNWTGKRIWNTTDLRPKLVFARAVDGQFLTRSAA